jgi:NitT/TauT family transport system ATP-binding protein
VTSRVRVSIRDLAKTFGQGPREVPAVSPVSFDVHEREFVALVGPSGCGKSTILNMIGGLVAPSGGEIVVDGQRVVGTPPPQVGYVFQKDTVFPWRTVERNIALGLEYRNVPTEERAARIVVMTRRPGRIKLIYDVKLPRPRDVIRIRETNEYSRQYSEIWHTLGDEFRAPTA